MRKTLNYKKGEKSVENPKIRLIFCDVDGTLLNKGEETVSDSVFHAINTAFLSGIDFVIASGRPYYNLKELFKPVADFVTFISSDGALTVKNGNVISSFPIEKNITDRFLDIPREKTFLYSKDGLSENYNMPVYKLAFYDTSPFERQRAEIIAKNTGRLTKIYSDSSWIEFILSDTSKGKAAKTYQNSLGISELETAAFGDNTNDFEMLRCASLTFSSPYAIPEVKTMCKYNAENVPSEILRLAQER